jgi:hypothetical protein
MDEQRIFFIIKISIMSSYEIIKNQIVAGTGMDNHGENYSKDFFEDLLASLPPRLPLHAQHQMSKETSGYLQNFRLVPHEGEWVVIADVFINEGYSSPDLGGFSFSATQPMAGNLESPLNLVYLPYPAYNDQELIGELLREDPNLMVGKWIKKGLSDLQIGLIASTVCLLIGPEWDIQYKENVRPAINELLTYVSKLRARKIPVDLVQQVDFAGKTVQLYFIPERANSDAEAESLKIENFECGYRKAIAALESEPKSFTIGPTRVKLLFDLSVKEFKVVHIQFEDGTDVNII